MVNDPLPKLMGRLKERLELFCHLETDDLRVWGEDSLLQCVCQNEEKVCLLLGLEIQLLPVDHNVQVMTQMHELISMKGYMGEQLSNHQQIARY